MFRAAVISFFAQIVWILPAVFVSWFFVPGLPVLLVYTYMPIISLLLALPISFGGFGAREALYTLFFVPYGFSAESLLSMSAFMGVVQLISAALGGLFIFL
jgi:hypothetical protein